MRDMIKPLICIPSPRDIPEFKYSMEKISLDKYWVKYYSEPEAYDKIRSFFLEHDEYTHMILLPDDLISSSMAINHLMVDATVYECPVVSGISNIDYQRRDIYNVRRSFGTAPEDYFINKMNWHEIIEREGIVIRVKSTNFTCYVIRRDVVEKIPFKHPAPDSEFDKDCERLDIPIYCDLGAWFFHRSNPFGDMSFEHFYVNRKPSTTIYDKWNV